MLHELTYFASAEFCANFCEIYQFGEEKKTEPTYSNSTKYYQSTDLQV